MRPCLRIKKGGNDSVNHTMKDERVCPDCQKHKGIKVDDVYDSSIGVNHPPFHDDCRYIATYSVEEIRTPGELRKVISRLNDEHRQEKEGALNKKSIE